MKEDKQLICNALTEAMKLTRGGKDLREIRYKEQEGDEFAEIQFDSSGRLVVNITADSGLAMIRDITEALI